MKIYWMEKGGVITFYILGKDSLRISVFQRRRRISLNRENENTGFLENMDFDM